MASWVKTVLGAVAFAVPVTITCMDYIGLVVKVEGESMQPVLNPDLKERHADYVYLNTWSAKTRQIQRGEIVTFVSPRNPDEALIKRIIGLEGDCVRTNRDKMVFIPKGHCWVEGENRSRSLDSNSFGAISMGLIQGKASHIVWPPHRWQKLEPKEIDSDRLQPCHRDTDFR